MIRNIILLLMLVAWITNTIRGAIYTSKRAKELWKKIKSIGPYWRQHGYTLKQFGKDRGKTIGIVLAILLGIVGFITLIVLVFTRERSEGEKIGFSVIIAAVWITYAINNKK